MLSNCSSKTRVATADVSRRYMSANAVRAPMRAVNVVCAAGPATTWDSWSNYLTAARKGAKAATPDEAVFSKLAVEVATAAQTFKPRFGGGTAGKQTPVKAAAPIKKGVSAVSGALQKRLDTIGSQRLAELTGVSVDNAVHESYTTTEVGAAVSISSIVVEKGGEKHAAVVFLVTESERGVSWSRLEGLILHWAVADKPGGAWTMPPPAGWTAKPSKGSDGGGAWNSGFEKMSLPGGNDTAYTLAMTLPLKGTLKNNGVSFVLKAAEGQNTRWLKDAHGDADFFLDLQALPTVRA